MCIKIIHSYTSSGQMITVGTGYIVLNPLVGLI